MQHAWVFDVLEDLLIYARTNDLPALAARVEVALAVARAEIAARDADPAPDAGRPSGLGQTH